MAASSFFDDMQLWYPLLAQQRAVAGFDLIPATLTGPLSANIVKMLALAPPLAEALYFRERRAAAAAAAAAEDADAETSDAAFEARVCALLREHLRKADLGDALADLEQILHQQQPEERLFVRLSTRSPKDALLKCSGHAMRLVSSARVREDAQRALAQHAALALVTRPFVELSHEVRVFVHEGAVTAVSQYSTMALDDAIGAELLANKDAILALVDSVVACLPHGADGAPSVVVDCGRRPSGGYTVIELNPFGRATGGCFFSWAVDKAVLHGTAPFEFRVRCSARSQAM